jgi:phosphatidylserine/phosphatidylglycerophosphate/cardiolipin synthase-like enzyme
MRSLVGVPLADLRALHSGLVCGSLRLPLDGLGLEHAGLRHVAGAVQHALSHLDRPGAIALIEVAISERTLRPVPDVELVWTGLEATHAHARDTAVVMRELFAGAKHSVLVAGYRFDHVKDVLDPLHSAMRDRSVAARLFVDIRRSPGDPKDPDACAQRFVDRFFQQQWRWTDHRPEVFYDPRTAEERPPGQAVSLHAKCVVVDELRTLIGSANFTARGQARNIEAGALIEDPRLADRLVRQWTALVAAGSLRQAC